MNTLDYELAGMRLRLCSEGILEETELWRPFRCNSTEPPMHTYELRWKQSFAHDMGALLLETPEVCVTQSKMGVCRRYRLAQTEEFHAVATECGAKTVVEVLRKNTPWGQNAQQLFRVLSLPHLLLRHGCILLHGAYLDIGGEAIVFSAPPETGKTTQARLWMKHRGARIVNGDCVIVGMTAGRVCAYGVPTCGTSGICENRTLPLRAVIFLSQGRENRALLCSARQALRSLSENTYHEPDRPEDALARIDLSLALIKAIPMISFACLPEQSAVDALEALLTGL